MSGVTGQQLDRELELDREHARSQRFLGAVVVFVFSVPAVVWAWSSSDLQGRFFSVCGVVILWSIWATKPPGWSWWRHINAGPAKFLGPLAAVAALLAGLWWFVAEPQIHAWIHEAQASVPHVTLPAVPSWLQHLGSKR